MQERVCGGCSRRLALVLYAVGGALTDVSRVSCSLRGSRGSIGQEFYNGRPEGTDDLLDTANLATEYVLQRSLL